MGSEVLAVFGDPEAGAAYRIAFSQREFKIERWGQVEHRTGEVSWQWKDEAWCSSLRNAVKCILTRAARDVDFPSDMLPADGLARVEARIHALETAALRLTATLEALVEQEPEKEPTP